MISISYTELLCLLLVPLTIILLFFTLSLKNRLAALQKKYDDLQTQFYKLQNINENLSENFQHQQDFQESLKEAEVTTILQEPRLKQSRQSTKVSTAAPNRYEAFQSLCQTGMSLEKISSTLAISYQEAEQLLKLSKLAGNN